MLRHRLSSLKNLPVLRPDKDWLEKTRYELLAEVAAQSKLSSAHRLDWSERADLFFSAALRRVLPSLAKMIAIFLIISLGSGVALAAQAAVPGEMLWPMKRSMEQAELSLTFSQIKETEIHLKHVNNRLGEIDKILQDNTLVSVHSASKEKAIKQVVRHLEKDVTGADSSLKIVKEENKPSEVVELVQKVRAVTKEVQTNIKEKQAVVSDKVIGDVLKEAEVASKKVNDSAVNLAVQVHEEVVAAANMTAGDLANAVATGTVAVAVAKVDDQEVQAIKDGVKAIIENEIKETSSAVQDIKVKAEAVDVKDLPQARVNTTGQPTVAYAEVESVVKKMPAVAEGKLDEAKALLKEGAVKEAFSKVTETKEVSHKAEVVLQKLDQIVIDNQSRSDATNLKATSTVPLPTPTNQPTKPAKKVEASAIPEDLPAVGIQSIDVPLEPAKLEKEQ